MASTLVLNPVKNQDGTITLSWDAQFDGNPWALTISIIYGRKRTATSQEQPWVAWSSKANPDLAIPVGPLTFDPKAWNSNATVVTFAGYVATSEDQTGQDVVEVQADKVTIKL